MFTHPKIKKQGEHMFNLPQSTFGRRSFLRFSALSVAAGSFLMNPISKAVAQAVKEIEPFYWNACVINCGQRCPQRCFVKGGKSFALKPTTPPVTPAIIVRFAPACAAVH